MCIALMRNRCCSKPCGACWSCAVHVERLQLEAGELIIQGEIGLLEYDDSVQPRDSLFRRIFGG